LLDAADDKASDGVSAAVKIHIRIPSSRVCTWFFNHRVEGRRRFDGGRQGRIANAALDSSDGRRGPVATVHIDGKMISFRIDSPEDSCVTSYITTV
jgi:hypothetical protein